MDDKKEPESVRDHSEFVKKYFWLIRPCEDYSREASECRSISGRFHQYFIDGSFTDCSHWLQNSAHCSKCIEDFDDGSCTKIIKNESERRIKRLENHRNNNVWEKRDKPPDNWNPPLPEWFCEERKNSLFETNKEEFFDFMENSDPKVSYCTIL